MCGRRGGSGIRCRRWCRCWSRGRPLQCAGPLAVAQAAAGWGQEVLAAHGCRVSPRTGLRVAPSASMLDRLARLLDADELEAALTGAVAALARDPAIPAAYAVRRAEQQREQDARRNKRKRRPPAAAGFREEREDGWFRPHPAHPWLDPAVAGDPGHVPARQGVAVDGKERKLAKAGGKKKVHLLAAVTHVPGLVIAQDKVAKSGKANEISHFRPLLAPLPLDGVVVTSDAMQANREKARWLQKARNAHYLWPVEHSSHCSCCWSWCVKESSLAVSGLDAEPFAASLGEVDGVEFAALDLVQHGLAGDAEAGGGLAEGQPAVGGLGPDAVAELLVDADVPGCSGGELLAGDEAVAEPPVDGGGGDAELASGFGDGDHDRILAAGSDISGGCLVLGDAVVGAQRPDVGFPEGQSGCGAAVLLAEDLGDGGVVVAACQPADQVQGVLARDAAVAAAGGHRHLQQGAGAALPDDLHFARPGGVVVAVVLHGDGDLGDDRADEFLALGAGGGRGLEDGPQVGSGAGDPGGFLLGEGDGPAALLGGELVLRGAHGS